MSSELLAAHVILSGSLDSNVPFFVAPASATTMLVTVGGSGATTLNVPVLVELSPFESVAVIAYVWLPAAHVPIGQE